MSPTDTGPDVPLQPQILPEPEPLPEAIDEASIMAEAEDPTKPSTEPDAPAGDGGDTSTAEAGTDANEPEAAPSDDPHEVETDEPEDPNHDAEVAKHLATIDAGLKALPDTIHDAVAAELANTPTVEADGAASRIRAKVHAALTDIRDAWEKLNGAD